MYIHIHIYIYSLEQDVHMVFDNAMLFESSSSHMTYILLLSFEQDVYMVFDNAMLFNPPGSDVHACAKTLKDKVREHINKRRRREHIIREHIRCACVRQDPQGQSKRTH
jgi:hypothetical protein